MSVLDEIRARHEAGEPRGDWDREWLLGEVDRLRVECDELLLAAREFVRWFNTHYPNPTDHPWCVIKDRLKAHADRLAALDAPKTKTDKEDRQ